jgi:regulator of protease activity HflC (stomatin/prohibitin superfamily)
MSLFTLTVGPTARGLERRPGRPTRVLAPGRHRRRWRARYEGVDVRERTTLLAPQDVLSADGITLRATAAVRWTVVDPVAFTETHEDPVSVVYLAVQVALRDALAERDAEVLVRAARDEVTERLAAASRTAAGRYGLQVLDVVVKDLLLPPELRAAFAETVVVRRRGQAQLEAARAETAATRSLANAARLLEDHPALARLKLVQALPPGAKVVLEPPSP